MPRNVFIADPSESQATKEEVVVQQEGEDSDIDVENPFSDVPANQMPVEDIEIEVIPEDLQVGDLHSNNTIDDPIFNDGLLDDTVELTVTGKIPKRKEYFKPLTAEDRETIAKYCGITMPSDTDEPVFNGIGRLYEIGFAL